MRSPMNRAPKGRAQVKAPTSSLFDQMTAEAALRTACRPLTNPGDAEAKIDRAVSLLLTVGRAVRSNSPAPRTAFDLASRPTCERELRTLSKRAQALVEALVSLHQPTILALSDVGFESSLRTKLPDTLRRMGVQADSATIPDQPPNAGRGAKPRQSLRGLGLVAGKAYHDITGRTPTFTTNPDTSAVSGLWPTFLKDVFSAIGVDGYSDRLMRTVAAEMRSRK
jgi:hypothetical protein